MQDTWAVGPKRAGLGASRPAHSCLSSAAMSALVPTREGPKKCVVDLRGPNNPMPPKSSPGGCDGLPLGPYARCGTLAPLGWGAFFVHPISPVWKVELCSALE